MTWEIGDKALCVNANECPKCEGAKFSTLLAQGVIYTVSGVDADDLGVLLDLIEVVPPTPTWAFCAEHFSKIRPDTIEQCEPEFITLLKRSKVPETASDWLIRVAVRVTEQVREWRKEDEDNGRPW